MVFNGKYAEEMAIDTGASIIALPAKMARDAGLTPTADAPKVQLQMADGHTVEGRMIYAEKVRVGKFTAEHVECSVLPPEFSDAAPLLGLSFWRNFTFKIDNEKAKLTMSKVDVPEKTAARRTAASQAPSRSACASGTVHHRQRRANERTRLCFSEVGYASA